MHSQNERFFTDFDIYLWKQGSFFRAWEKMGAHPCRMNGRDGVHFAVWAPNAERVCVVGDFNDWREGAHELEPLEDTGIWHGFVPEIGPGVLYKYAVTSRHGGYKVQKADPYGFFCEIRPQTASIVWDLSGHQWNDSQWMRDRGRANSREAPISIYEVHLGSWMRVAEEGNRWLTYRELAPRLAEYVTEMGFTHVELLPITEHPFDGSWGYQTVGYFAPTSRFGTPQDFMAFVDILHQNGIGVILDWVPAHFPTDEHGLGFFDGSHLYEHADPRLGFHNDWKSFIFNFGRNEVINFLISSALFWLDVYHVDGLRVDAVASMLYLDYSRQDGEWIPNKYGGNENLEAIAFLKRFNEVVYREFPDVLTIAEESTAWPMVSRPTYLGGLGFGFKWNMGWMHDTLLYFSKDPIHRKYHHNHLTFSILYAFTENFVLPFSHDEVVHGKGSMPAKMPGDLWQKFANLRLLYGYMFTHPGKKLLFMGNEFGQWSEWNHDAALDWHLLQYESHRGLQAWVRDLNAVIRREAALYELDHDPHGFEWIDCNDSEQSTLVYLRRSKREEDVVVCAFNFTPVPRQPYRLGVPFGGYWKEVLNSDADLYGGSGLGNLGGVEAEPVPFHGRPYSLSITLPPLGAVLFQPAEPPGK